MRSSALPLHGPPASGASAQSAFAQQGAQQGGYGQQLAAGYNTYSGQAVSAPSSPLRTGTAKFGSVPATFDRASLPNREALLASIAARNSNAGGHMLQEAAPAAPPQPGSPAEAFARATAFSGSLSAGYPAGYSAGGLGAPLSEPLRSAPLPSGGGGGVGGGGGLDNPVGSGGFTVTSGASAHAPTSPFQQLGAGEPFAGGAWEAAGRPGGVGGPGRPAVGGALGGPFGNPSNVVVTLAPPSACADGDAAGAPGRARDVAGAPPAIQRMRGGGGVAKLGGVDSSGSTLSRGGRGGGDAGGARSTGHAPAAPKAPAEGAGDGEAEGDESDATNADTNDPDWAGEEGDDAAGAPATRPAAPPKRGGAGRGGAGAPAAAGGRGEPGGGPSLADARASKSGDSLAWQDGPPAAGASNKRTGRPGRRPGAGAGARAGGCGAGPYGAASPRAGGAGSLSPSGGGGGGEGGASERRGGKRSLPSRNAKKGAAAAAAMDRSEDDEGDDFGSDDLGHSSDLGGPDGKRRKARARLARSAGRE